MSMYVKKKVNIITLNSTNWVLHSAWKTIRLQTWDQLTFISSCIYFYWPRSQHQNIVTSSSLSNFNIFLSDSASITSLLQEIWNVMNRCLNHVNNNEFFKTLCIVSPVNSCVWMHSKKWKKEGRKEVYLNVLSRERPTLDDRINWYPRYNKLSAFFIWFCWPCSGTNSPEFNIRSPPTDTSKYAPSSLNCFNYFLYFIKHTSYKEWNVFIYM